MKTARRPGPKPQGPFQDKRRILTTRITGSTRDMLDAAAAANDRSLSQEIEMRLERSFNEDRSLGGPTSASAFRACADIAMSQSAHRGVDWLADQKLFDFVLDEWNGLWRRLLRPEPREEG